MPFPPDFLWGAATASYQIEGAVTEDGRGESIWDRFSHTPGAVENGHTGDVACDHYHRWPADLDLMQDVGLSAYRFSIAWPRIYPQGGGLINQRGLDFYARLVDGLLERGITPMATLYHWDLPQELETRLGGWGSREVAERFADYAATVFGALGDRVPYWVTINEPWVAAFIGYYTGRHAPGQEDLAKAVRASHHLLLGHARAIQVYRSLGLPGKIGITLDLQTASPDGDSDEDRRAAMLGDGYTNRWFLDPLFRGRYPEDVLELFRGHGAALDAVGSGDMESIAAPIDFLGMNFYMRRLFSASSNGLGWDERLARDGDDTTEMGWAIVPEALAEQLARLRADYPSIPLYITENGMAEQDSVGADGTVRDTRRIDYIRRHLQVIEEAIAAGSDLRGYFVWSWMDNFEWGFGYRPRFGIVHVDFETQARTLKDSARWYAEVIRTNGGTLGG
ncbi:MAG TPA: GH1 family beta-glucosidase [Clostridia bacterium]|nr:GH1 family beta-glucosidase [Clostridia bacterium]